MEIINPLDYNDWDAMISAFPEANCFHTVGWLRTLVDTYNYKPQYATWWNGGRLVGVIPLIEVKSCLTGKRGVSLPFTDICPFLFSGCFDVEEKVSQIIEFGKLRKWKYLETRGPTTNGQRTEKNGELSFFVHTIDLTHGEESIFENFRSSTRRNIRKAEKHGVTVVEDNTPGGVREFYRLNTLRRRDHGVPPQPLKFFENLLLNVIEPGHGKILFAKYQGVNIAGVICLSFNGNGIFKYGASDMRYQEIRANNLLLWEAINTCCAKGGKVFHFGKTEPDHKGLLQFKRGWGPVEESVAYTKYDMRSGIGSITPYSNRKSYNKFFSKMPLPLLNLAGKIFYRHMG